MFIIQSVIIKNLEVKAVGHLINSTFFNSTLRIASVQRDCFNVVCRRATVEQEEPLRGCKNGGFTANTWQERPSGLQLPLKKKNTCGGGGGVKAAQRTLNPLLSLFIIT